MNSRQLLALSLADAMLTGPPEGARERCVRVLGDNARWLAPLIAQILREYGHAWHIHSREAVTESILQAGGFVRAQRSKHPPRVRVLPIEPPRMAPARIALGAIALPNLPSTGDIASWLETETKELLWLSGSYEFNASQAPPLCQHYHHRWVEKRSGGWRLLETPKPRLCAIQRKILHEMLEFVPLHEAVHGFRTRHSTLTNAREHAGKRIVIKLDLHDFFLKITAARVRGFFKALGYPLQAANILTGLCTHGTPPYILSAGKDPARYAFECPSPDWRQRRLYANPHLPQGAPTSPALSNLCAFNLDVRLHGLAQAMGAVYTRYADDLTFSGGDELVRAAERLPVQVGAMALEEGFALNHRKTRIMRASARQQVTGIVVNTHPNVARDDFDRLKATLHNCRLRGGPSQNRESHGDFRAHLAGRIAYIRGIAPQRGERLQHMFDQVSWK
jgi:RNA-directed DNA polymerase